MNTTRRLLLIGGLLLAAGTAYAADKKELKTPKDRLSYSAGYDMALKIKESGIALDYDLVLQAARDVLKGGKTLMTREEVANVVMSYRVDRRNELAEKNKREGAAFLAENTKQAGVVTLPSGLQYRVLKEGTGRKPGAGDIVTVHYRGTLVSGDEFDSSLKRGQPATFPLNQVIKGWTEGVQLMGEGARWQFFIPAELAYGERGVPDTPIGPNAALIFEIELLSVAEGPQPQSGGSGQAK